MKKHLLISFLTLFLISSKSSLGQQVDSIQAVERQQQIEENKDKIRKKIEKKERKREKALKKAEKQAQKANKALKKAERQERKRDKEMRKLRKEEEKRNKLRNETSN